MTNGSIRSGGHHLEFTLAEQECSNPREGNAARTEFC